MMMVVSCVYRSCCPVVALSLVLLAVAGFGGGAVMAQKEERDSSRLRAYTITADTSRPEQIDYRAYKYYVDGLIHEHGGDIPKAASAYERALRYFPTDNRS